MESTLLQEKSTHQCPVFKFDFSETLTHPNAERLRISKIKDTEYTYCLNINDWENFSGLVSWVPPDSLVPVNLDQFSFLAEEAKYDENSNTDKSGIYARIKAKKLRGIVSYGLLVKLPKNSGLNEGDNAALLLNVKHFEPPIELEKGQNQKGQCAKSPSGTFYKYDVDSLMSHAKNCLIEGEEVIVFEKIHGQNAKIVYKNGEFYVGSRTLWKKEFDDPPDLTIESLIEKGVEQEKAKEIYEKRVVNWKCDRNYMWKVMFANPDMIQWLKDNEGYCIYGELFGQIQKGFSYGCKPGENRFLAFDILKPDGQWMHNVESYELSQKYNIPWVPLLFKGPYNLDNLLNLIERKKSTLHEGTIMEGCVVTPTNERYDNKIGRIKLKLINSLYSERS